MKSKMIKDCFGIMAQKLVRTCPDFLTGSGKVMRQKFQIKYGTKDCEVLIEKSKINIMLAYMLIIGFFLLILCGALVTQIFEKEQIINVNRPGIEESSITVPMIATVSYKDYKWEKNVSMKIESKTPNYKEKKRKVINYENKLENLILGENEDINHISKPLNLVEKENGITVVWKSSEPEIINENGEIDLFNAKDGQRINLIAEVTFDNITEQKLIKLKIERDAAIEDYEQSINKRLSETLDILGSSDECQRIQMPNQLGNGIKIKWENGSSSNVFTIIVIFVFALFIVYCKRYEFIDKEIKNVKTSIAKDLPEFINKLVLLLNAGLVVSSAFNKIVMEYSHSNERYFRNNKRKERYLYEELCEIQNRVNKSNNSLIKELKDFSRQSGVRELIRVIAVISDNWDKGSTLAEKLEAESELLWYSRKKRAEEKGKLAETKLTLPLMILLIVLIMVTIAPALMEM